MLQFVTGGGGVGNIVLSEVEEKKLPKMFRV